MPRAAAPSPCCGSADAVDRHRLAGQRRHVDLDARRRCSRASARDAVALLDRAGRRPARARVRLDLPAARRRAAPCACCGQVARRAPRRPARPALLHERERGVEQDDGDDRATEDRRPGKPGEDAAAHSSSASGWTSCGRGRGPNDGGRGGRARSRAVLEKPSLDLRGLQPFRARAEVTEQPLLGLERVRSGDGPPRQGLRGRCATPGTYTRGPPEGFRRLDQEVVRLQWGTRCRQRSFRLNCRVSRPASASAHGLNRHAAFPQGKRVGCRARALSRKTRYDLRCGPEACR